MISHRNPFPVLHMRSIGLIGGMSWESTCLYYQIINREVSRRSGKLHSAKLLLNSLDFEEVVRAQEASAWQELASTLSGAARNLELSGADCILIGTNTMHRVADAVQAAVSVPLLHIADVTGAAILEAGCSRVLLLGTRYTMEQRFYVEHLGRLGIECMVPAQQQSRDEVHRIIFEELCKGVFKDDSRRSLRSLIQEQVANGAQGVILGCTELPLLLSREDAALPLFDTTELHALAAVEFAMSVAPPTPQALQATMACAPAALLPPDRGRLAVRRI